METLIGKSLQQYEAKIVEGDEFNITNSQRIQVEAKENCSKTDTNRYKCYLKASGNCFFAYILCFLFVLALIFATVSDMFLSFWINLRQGGYVLSPEILNFLTDLNCLYLYSTLFLSLIFLYHFSGWVFVKFSKNCSTHLHDGLFKKILHASMTFFDCHSSGRILNRFSADMNTIDQFIPHMLYLLSRQGFTAFGNCVVVVIVNYWILIPTVALSLFCYYYCLVFLPTVNRTRRIAAIRKSPNLTHVSSTIQGLTTIKALKAELLSLSKFDEQQNMLNSMEYLHLSVSFAYTFWIDCICNLYTAVVIFFFIYFEENLVGDVGLAITQSLLISSSAQLVVRVYNDLNTQMTSVERVVEYTDVEAEKDPGTLEVTDMWPESGEITFSGVSMRYSNDKPFVLKKIDLEIKPGEKVGIIGRTGAGKSSLIGALLRLYHFDGTILVDGIDINVVSLKTLRSKIAVIPQDPVFFLGTLRKNLDPFDKFDDNSLWSVLEDVKLKSLVSNLPSGLESPILDGGTNLSVGQRQMFCLVRAILKNAKIVVLDEATANVDLESDEMIQTTIRKRLRSSTVLTIAHRLDTVMDSDRILVMDEGSVVEFGTRDELLQDSASRFYSYVHEM